MSLKLTNNTQYTYQNNLSVTKWVEGNETNAKNESSNFKTIMQPISKGSKGFKVYEVVSETDNGDLLYLIGKKPVRLPEIKYYPYFPVGVWENDDSQKGQNPVPIKYVSCDQVFRTSEEIISSDGKLTVSKRSINKVHGISKGQIQLESRRVIKLKGILDGSGEEDSTIYLVDGTSEVALEKTVFKYEYRTGYGDARHTEKMTGEYTKRLIKKEKYKRAGMSFPDLTSPSNTVPYYTNKEGLFVPVKLNNELSIKAYFDPAETGSYIDYSFYIENSKGKPKDYFYPIDKLSIGKSVLLYPEIEIINSEEEFGKSDYKVPGRIGNNIISKGAVYINTKKRTLSFYEPDDKEETPEKATLFDIVNDIPVFNIIVNGTTVKATISFSNEEPEMSYKLQKQLLLKTRKIAVSEKDPNENYIEKTGIIISPPGKTYVKAEAVVKNLGNVPYDLKLGRNYIKDKELTINYNGEWMLIKD